MAAAATTITVIVVDVTGSAAEAAGIGVAGILARPRDATVGPRAVGVVANPAVAALAPLSVASPEVARVHAQPARGRFVHACRPALGGRFRAWPVYRVGPRFDQPRYVVDPELAQPHLRPSRPFNPRPRFAAA